MDKDFPMICMIFHFSWGAMIFTKIPLSYENHLSACRGWDFNEKNGTGSIFQIGPSYTNITPLKVAASTRGQWTAGPRTDRPWTALLSSAGP